MPFTTNTALTIERCVASQREYAAHAQWAMRDGDGWLADRMARRYWVWTNALRELQAEHDRTMSRIDQEELEELCISRYWYAGRGCVCGTHT